jgi:hypothetical protein
MITNPIKIDIGLSSTTEIDYRIEHPLIGVLLFSIIKCPTVVEYIYNCNKRMLFTLDEYDTDKQIKNIVNGKKNLTYIPLGVYVALLRDFLYNHNGKYQQKKVSEDMQSAFDDLFLLFQSYDVIMNGVHFDTVTYSYENNYYNATDNINSSSFNSNDKIMDHVDIMFSDCLRYTEAEREASIATNNRSLFDVSYIYDMAKDTFRAEYEEVLRKGMSDIAEAVYDGEGNNQMEEIDNYIDEVNGLHESVLYSRYRS